MADRSWGDLPDKCLSRLIRHLPCILDHGTFSCVCKKWRSTAQQHPAPQLPWLLMLSDAGISSFFCVASGDTHRRPVLPDLAPGTRLCGSFSGGWLVAAAPRSEGPVMLNVFTGESIELPGSLLVNVFGGRRSRCAMVVRAVTLSAAPSSSRQYCAAAILSSQSSIAFWQPGMDHWTPPMCKEPDDAWRNLVPREAIEDVIYYGGGAGRGRTGFYALTSSEDIWVYGPEIGDGGALNLHFAGNRVTSPGAGQVVARYLVESRGKLMMVVRFVSPGQDGTVSFNLFELKRKWIVDGDVVENALATWNWLDVGTLTGRRIFLGRGCSMAVDVKDDDHSPLCIDFLDDAVGAHGAQTLRQVQNTFLSRDTGRYFNQQIVRSLPRDPPSNVSPWIWFFLSEATYRSGGA